MQWVTRLSALCVVGRAMSRPVCPHFPRSIWRISWYVFTLAASCPWILLAGNFLEKKKKKSQLEKEKAMM